MLSITPQNFFLSEETHQHVYYPLHWSTLLILQLETLKHTKDENCSRSLKQVVAEELGIPPTETSRYNNFFFFRYTFTFPFGLPFPKQNNKTNLETEVVIRKQVILYCFLRSIASETSISYCFRFQQRHYISVRS